jgi:hypothetical protein
MLPAYWDAVLLHSHIDSFLFLFTVYLTMLSVTPTIMRRMVGRSMNDEMESMRNKAILCY